MALQLVPKRRALPNPSLVRLFSTAADPDDRNDRSRSSFSSYFSDVKSTLRQEQSSSSSSSSSPPIHRLRRSPPSSPSGFQPPPVKSLLEVRQSLSAFRRPVADSSPPPDDSAQPSPFRSLFNRTAAENGDATAGRLSWGSIRESLGSMKQQSVASEKQSSPLSALRQSLRMPQPDGYSPPLSRTSEDLPSSVFGREMREKEDGRGGGLGASAAMKTDFVKGYGYEELGDKLKKLRPEGKKEEGGWFSIEELNGRLEKLRDSELKETDSLFGGSYKHVRHSLINLAEDSKSKRNAMESFDILGQLGRTPSYMKLPPKEHLLETYNHPDNMSAAEKMKIELAKVREEFKMSESDCGSTRIQVALLTTKIKYLSSVLHKKDKHSRKGLVEMVHKRKRLLKYLRRTDWDSYCFVLDKLGLRDTPEYKTYDYKR